MTKRRWIVTAVVVGLLIVGVTGGTLMAQQAGDDDGDDAETKSFADRVAEILGLDTETVEDAFVQAKRNVFEERVSKRLGADVEKGLIDQAKADEIMEWLAERPDGVPSWLLRDGDDRGGVMKKRGFGPYGFHDGRRGAIIEKFSFDTFGDEDDEGGPKVFSWDRSGKGGPKVFSWDRSGRGGPKIFSWDRSGRGGPGIWAFPGRGGFSFEGAPEGLAESLERAVEKGVISREMADRILERIGGGADEDDSDEES